MPFSQRGRSFQTVASPVNEILLFQDRRLLSSAKRRAKRVRETSEGRAWLRLRYDGVVWDGGFSRSTRGAAIAPASLRTRRALCDQRAALTRA